MTDDHPRDDNDSERRMRELDDHGGTPEWARQDPTAAVDYLMTGWTRSELQALIGDEVGFEHDPDHDRLRKEELAQILVFVLALRGKL